MNQKDTNSQDPNMPTKTSSSIKKTVTDGGSAIVGAIVGLAIGGPVGAVIGAATPPILSNTIERVIERRQQRAERIVEGAFIAAGVTPEEGTALLSSDDNKTDEFMKLLRQAIESDPSVDAVFGAIIGEILTAKSTKQQERLLILADALRHIRPIHLRILRLLSDAGGILKANDMASELDIPEIELRSVVRDLELRGMIRDRKTRPLEWELRALGNAIDRFTAQNKGGMNNATLPE